MSPFNRISYCTATCALVWLVSAIGCGGERRTAVDGYVRCQGQVVETGEVRFVPLDAQGGAARRIYRFVLVDGYYQTAAEQGLPPGKYRVEIDALRKTGRQIEANAGLESVKTDETVPIGPDEFASAHSPLELVVDGGASLTFHIDVPPREEPGG